MEFKAYDKINDLHYNSYNSGIEVNVNGNYVSNLKITAFTGCFSINGEKLYENDCVSSVNSTPNIKGVIIFHEGAFFICNDKDMVPLYQYKHLVLLKDVKASDIKPKIKELKICCICWRAFTELNCCNCCNECCVKDHDGYHCSGCGCGLDKDYDEGGYCPNCS